MYHLSSLHTGNVGLTTTTHMKIIKSDAIQITILDKSWDLTKKVRRENSTRVEGFVNNLRKVNYYSGIDPETVTHIYEKANLDLCLVKVDGARGKLIKSAADYEPVLPTYFHSFIPVVSAKAVGRRLTKKIAHRPELISKITGLKAGETISTNHIAKLIAHPDGLLKGSGSAVVVPVITMVDDDILSNHAMEISETALDLTDRFDRIVLYSRKNAGLVKLVVRQ